jgi:hypothetical protein
MSIPNLLPDLSSLDLMLEQKRFGISLRKKTMFFYELPTPIDWSWELLPTINQFIDSIINANNEDVSKQLFNFISFFSKGFEKTCSDLSDLSEEPRVFSLPTNNGVFVFGVAYKEKNNGRTVIVSPVFLDSIFSINNESLPYDATEYLVV